MIVNPMERRRIEQFNKILDQSETHDHLHSQPSSSSEEELFDMVGATEQLDHLGDHMTRSISPDQDFQAKLRQRLMAVAAVQGIGATAKHHASAPVADPVTAPVTDTEPGPRRFRGGRRLAILAALLTGTVALSGVSTASGDAMPGDALYGVKRSTESAQLALAGSDLSKAQLHLEFARTRVHEAVAVSSDDDAVIATLEDMNSEILAGASLLGEVAAEDTDAAALDHFDHFANGHRHDMVSLISDLDGEPREVATESLTLLEDASMRSVQLRSAISCTDHNGPSDQFGPLPGACGSLPASDTSDLEDTTGDSSDADSSGAGETGTGSDPTDIDDPEPSQSSDGSGLTVEEPEEESATDEESESPETTSDDEAGGESDSEPEDSGGLLDEVGSVLDGLLGGND